YPQYPADEIPNLTLTPSLTNYVLPISPVNIGNNSNSSSTIEQSGLHVFNAASYPKGPIILRLTRSGENNCSEPYLHLRLIYPHILNINISTDNITTIPTFNFCPISINPSRDLIRIFPLSYNHIMIAFLRNNTENGPETHEEFGIFIDWEGKIIQEMRLGFINFTTSDTSSLGTLVVDSSQRYGFIWVNRVSQKEYIRWQKYSISDLRIVNFTNGGNFSINPSHQYKIIATIDGGYCFVMAGPSGNNNSSFTDVQWVASAVFIRPSYYTTQPSLIYQYMLQAISMNIETCDNTYYEPGLACIFSIKTSNTSNISSRYVKVTFYSNGNIKSSATLNISDTNFIVDTMHQLWSGGYLLVVRWQPNNTFTGYIYDPQGNYFSIWNARSLFGSLVIPHGVFTNNTVWMFSDVTSTTPDTSSWELTTTIATKFITLDHVPDNLNINITFPNTTEYYEDKGLPMINMTFYNQIALSAKNISIYQDSGRDLVLRLYYNAQNNNSGNFNISPDLKVISINVLKSTFASPNSQYYVVMDNDFVKDFMSNEPLSGANWSFSTGPKSDEYLGNSEYALTRLNMNESSYYNSLPSKNRSDYLDQLKNELANSVPIDSSNIVAVSQYQWDKDANNLQILLKFQILPGNNSANGLTVVKIIDTLNDLITHRDVTVISSLPKSSNLDNQYGFVLKIPLGFNIMVSFFLLIHELSQQDTSFYEWFRTYHNVAAISTLCSGIDIDILTLITSKLADSQLFKAPLSESSKHCISRAGCFNFFIEDLPQLVIQICYVIWSVNYGIIPFINLVTSALLFSCIVIGRIYKSFRRKETPNYSTIEPYHDHDDGSSSKYGGEYIEDIPSSPRIVPETRVSPPNHVWISSFGLGNHGHGIPRTHSERINLPLAPLGRHNKVNVMPAEKPQIISNYENIENIENINSSPGITVTHIDGDRNGGEFEEGDSVIDKGHKYHSNGDYELVSYKAADSNDGEFEQDDLDVRHKFNSRSRYKPLSNNAIDS
ncbi:2087_t:CDS:2, partial [Gigaspora margarita]